MEADEQFYISLIEKHFGDNNILFDVGARKGEYSEYFLGKIKTKKAYLFDPNDYVLKDLNERFEGNANIILNQLAVDKENGTKDFYKVSLDSPMGGLSSLHFREDVFDKVIPETIEVQTIKLDDYCKENSIDEIDFLKIDTEGNELSCLLGAQELIKNKKIKKGEIVTIPKMRAHRIFAKKKKVEVLEIPYGTFDEKDEVRLEDKYGRK